MFGSIRAKIVWVFSILVALNLVAGFWSIYNFYVMGNTVATMLNENYRSVLAAEKMVQSLERQDNALLAASEGEEASAGGGFIENKELFYYWYDQAVLSVLPAGQQGLRDSIQNVYRYYAVLGDSMGARIGQGAVEGAKHYYYDKVRPVSDRLRALCFELFEINQATLSGAPLRMSAIASQSVYGALIASAVSLVLGVMATLWLIRVLIKPAEELTETVRGIGRGRLDLKIDVLSDDEIGQLSREFNKMTERLRQFEQMNIEKILSEKRTSEAIVESIADGLMVTDARGRIIHLNRTMADLLGVDEVKALGMSAASATRDARVLSLIGAWPRPGEAAPEQPAELLRFDREGGPRFYRVKLSRIQGAGGGPAGMVTLLQDVTQFKELDRMKSDFIATLSHEFRTPVTSITMSVDLLEQEVLGPLGSKQRELVRSAREDCHRLTKLARELLQLSKLESGRLPMARDQVDLRMAVESSVRPLRLQFGEKGVHLVNEIPPDLPSIIADEQQISWVITNLVTNALKHTDAGGIVRIRGARAASGVQVAVEDSGCGIPPEDLGRIFDKFVQVRRGADATPGSVGLGLAIAKEIVELHGGTLRVESTVGEGSTFSFEIPASGLPEARP
ncbi:MAG: ATP-binding protein [Bacteroidota bacterium]